MKPLHLALALLLLAAPAAAQTLLPRAERLVLALAVAPSGLDPHGYAASSDVSANANIFEALTRADPEGVLLPALAQSWTVTDEVIWDFALRPGVTFHDGSPLTAADAAASYERILNLKTSLRGNASRLRMVTAIEVRGPLALRLRTNGPAPGLAVDLAKLAVIRAASAAITDPEPFNSGREAVGTGPFRFAAYAPDAALELVRNESWWGDPSPWPAATIRFIPRDAVRVAALLAGDVDVIERVGAADAALLSARPGFNVTSAPALGAIYVILQLAREDGGPFLAAPDGSPLAVNPLRDRRVRQALSLAVNRGALTERLLQGAGQPASQFAPVGSIEHVPGVPPPAQDLARARALLAEAGYGAGLQIVLHGPAERYAGIAQVAETVAQMWSRIGVATRVEIMPWNIIARRAGRGEFAASLFACCATVADPLASARELVVTQDPARSLGGSNLGRFSNPALDRLVEAGLVTFDETARRAAATRAAEIISEEVPVVLLYHPLNVWAARAPIRFAARKDSLSPAIGAQKGGS